MRTFGNLSLLLSLLFQSSAYVSVHLSVDQSRVLAELDASMKDAKILPLMSSSHRLHQTAMLSIGYLRLLDM